MSSAALERPTDYQRAYEDATAAIRAFDEASRIVRQWVDHLSVLQRQRPRQKTEALTRLCAQPHPANPAKVYSITQAEDVLQLDPDYADYKARVAYAENALRETQDAQTSARMVAELAIAHMKREGGLS
jgi:predicted component of type VI protein secretion system